MSRTVDLFNVLSKGDTLDYTQEDIERANRTSRSRGAVGMKAITPRYVEGVIGKKCRVLDYGSGKEANHALLLRCKGYDVTAYEFGGNVVEGVHDTHALERTYEVVYASNVLNVQGNREMLERTLKEIKVLSEGLVYVNYPSSPNYTGVVVKDLENMIEKIFEVKAVRIGGSKTSPLYEVRF